MRITGTLKTWNEDRGFGFIVPIQGGPEVFVHLSAFPRDDVKPRPGERLSYEEASEQDGKVRAVRVTRLDSNVASKHQAAPRPRTPERARHQPPQSTSILSILVVLAAITAVGFAVVSKSRSERMPFGEVSEGPDSSPSTVPSIHGHALECDGRIRCGQMSSCAEAKFFLDNCPGTEMDGDGDGVPCESQWCGH
jgi:cold shock CspA family protein